MQQHASNGPFADDIEKANAGDGITAPLSVALAETLVRPLELACDLEQEALRETCLGMVHKLVRKQLCLEIMPLQACHTSGKTHKESTNQTCLLCQQRYEP